MHESPDDEELEADEVEVDEVEDEEDVAMKISEMECEPVVFGIFPPHPIKTNTIAPTYSFCDHLKKYRDIDLIPLMLFYL